MNVRAWADGFGVWHASVPVVGTVGEQEQAARKAIRSEMEARGEVGKGHRIRLHRVGESQQMTTDRAVYREA